MYKNCMTFKSFIIDYIHNFIFKGSYTQLWYLNATIFAVILIALLIRLNICPKTILYMAFILYIIGLFDQAWFGFISPLKELAPAFWSLLRTMKKIFISTSNGLFEGLFFVGIGMIMAFYKEKINVKKSSLGFVISMFLLFLEVIALRYFEIVRSSSIDLYLFLVPATYFLFSFVSQVKLNGSYIFYRNLRKLSSLIFYLHLWVNAVVSKLLKLYAYTLSKTGVEFVVTVCSTISLSLIIIKLSDNRKFRWIKWLIN